VIELVKLDQILLVIYNLKQSLGLIQELDFFFFLAALTISQIKLWRVYIFS